MAYVEPVVHGYNISADNTQITNLTIDNYNSLKVVCYCVVKVNDVEMDRTERVEIEAGQDYTFQYPLNCTTPITTTQTWTLTACFDDLVGTELSRTVINLQPNVYDPEVEYSISSNNKTIVNITIANRNTEQVQCVYSWTINNGPIDSGNVNIAADRYVTLGPFGPYTEAIDPTKLSLLNVIFSNSNGTQISSKRVTLKPHLNAPEVVDIWYSHPDYTKISPDIYNSNSVDVSYTYSYIINGTSYSGASGTLNALDTLSLNNLGNDQQIGKDSSFSITFSNPNYLDSSTTINISPYTVEVNSSFESTELNTETFKWYTIVKSASKEFELSELTGYGYSTSLTITGASITNWDPNNRKLTLSNIQPNIVAGVDKIVVNISCEKVWPVNFTKGNYIYEIYTSTDSTAQSGKSSGFCYPEGTEIHLFARIYEDTSRYTYSINGITREGDTYPAQEIDTEHHIWRIDDYSVESGGYNYGTINAIRVDWGGEGVIEYQKNDTTDVLNLNGNKYSFVNSNNEKDYFSNYYIYPYSWNLKNESFKINNTDDYINYPLQYDLTTQQYSAQFADWFDPDRDLQ